MNDKEVILSALQRERDELHDKLMQLDRIIKKVKGVDYSNENNGNDMQQLEVNTLMPQTIAPAKAFPKSTNIKVQVLTVIERLGVAVKLSAIQDEFTRITGSRYKVRDVVRGLHRQGILAMVKEIDTSRGVLWIKKDWVRNGVLLDEYKPEGFDMFYQASNLIFE